MASWLEVVGALVRENPARLPEWVQAAAVGFRSVVVDESAAEAMSHFVGDTLRVAGAIPAAEFDRTIELTASLAGLAPAALKVAVERVLGGGT